MNCKTHIRENKWAFAMTALYCLLLGWIILLKMSVSIDSLPQLRGFNLIPFYYDTETPFHLSEVVLNVLAFLPLGLCLKLLKLPFRAAVLLGFGYSLLLESLQFLLQLGVWDITDLITNTAGTLVGVLAYMGLAKPFPNARRLDRVLTVLMTAGIALLMALMLILILSNL